MKNFLLLFLIGLSAYSIKISAQNYSNIAPAQGINFSYENGELAGSVSFADFNQDGWDDLTFASKSGDLIHFYENNNGTFTKLPSLVNDIQESKEVLWVDFDNDGDLDLFISAYQGKIVLYENTGNLNLVDITETAGFPEATRNYFGAVWGDYNKDGWLDLYVCAFVYDDNLSTNFLFKNNGDGTFSDVTETAKCGDGFKPSFDACFIDYDSDGWPDLYITNDKYNISNTLYRNLGNGTFQDVSESSGAGCMINAMNAGGSDYNNDGYLDLYVSNTPEGNILYENNGDGTFSDVTAASGTVFNRIGWASTFFDYDNDMDKDLYVSCISNSANEPNAFYVNQNNGTFTEPLFATGGLGGNDLGVSFSHAIGDCDNDGMLDIAVVQMSATDHNLLWQNDETNSNNWIKIKLVGTSSNADGVGSFIEVYSAGVKQVRYTHCSMGYLGQNSDKYHFGLGSNTVIDSIIVRWPSGIVDKQTYPNILNQLETIVEGAMPALPLELLHFQAQTLGDYAIELDWATAIETNTSHFEIQRSEDGISYQRIGDVSAQGNTIKTSFYQFEDRNIESLKEYYYRLKMIDRDGSFTYSPVRTIRVGGNQTFFIEHGPNNPIHNGLATMEIVSLNDQVLNIRMFDRVGKLIKQFNEGLSKGQNSLSLDVSNVPAGAYFLYLEDETHYEGIQLIIAN